MGPRVVLAELMVEALPNQAIMALVVGELLEFFLRYHLITMELSVG